MAKMNISQFDTRSAKRSLRTPVSTPIPDSKQVLNSTGGYVWEVSDWDRLSRFLILGSEGGTYYVGESDLTKQNHDCVQRCLIEDTDRTIQTIVDISTQGRAVKNEPALFALALAASFDEGKITGTAEQRAMASTARQKAMAALPKVARTGTHLYHFTDYVTKLRGVGRSLRNALGTWFTDKTPEKIALQVVKYQQRDGWSARDLLRIAHPKAQSQEQEAIFRWVVGGLKATGLRTVKRKGNIAEVSYPDVREHLPALIEAFEQAKTASEKELVKLITEHNLPREAVPTEKLNSAIVWEALLQKMPMTALVRNLGKMTNVGLIRPLTEASKLVVKRLGETEYLRKSRIHPMQVLVATKIYGTGHGDKGKLSWTPVPAVLTALNEAFYQTFPNVKPCGKPLLIGLDVSSSMASSAAGVTSLCACEATAAFALVHANVEPECHIFGFASAGGGYGSTKFRELGIRKGMSLEDACRRAQQPFGATDISLAVQYALDNKLSVGGFLVMTDNEVNSSRHPTLALKEYRQKYVEDARSVMLATTATAFTCNDPNDRFGMDVVGFDSNTPSVVADFIRGEVPEEPVASVED